MDKIQRMNHTSEERKMMVSSFLIHISTLLFVIIIGLFYRIKWELMLQILGLSEIILMGYLYYLKKSCAIFFESNRELIIFLGAYLISLFFVLSAVNYSVYHLYMIGGMIITLFLQVNAGLLFTAAISLMVAVSGGSDSSTIVYEVIYSSIFCYFIHGIRDKRKLPYVAVIIFTSDLALRFIFHRFSLSEALKTETLFSLCSSMLLFIIAWGMVWFDNHRYNSDIGSKKRTRSNEMKNSEHADLQTNGTSLKELLEEDFSLIQAMESSSDMLYRNALLISGLSYKAALLIHKDESIAKAGGLYHKIGKLKTGNYIENGIAIAVSHHFPSEIIAIIKQHNVKYERPKSPEAAIVMLSDSLVAMLHYLDRNADNKKIPLIKVVDNILNQRLAAGDLDESGLTIEEFRLLRHFYCDELMSMKLKTAFLI